MTKIAEIFDIPGHVHEGDFVLKLVDGVEHADQTLREHVVTPQLCITTGWAGSLKCIFSTLMKAVM